MDRILLPGASSFIGREGEADAVLAGSGLPHAILRPGLVIGQNAFDGTEMLRTSAGLPFVSLWLRGLGTVQCVAMADLV